jgi:hypothetical protein
MKRRSRAGGEPIKGRRGKTPEPKRRNVPKVVTRSNSSSTGDETEVARLTRELNEAREQQTATAGVLRIVSASSGEVKPVFQAILNNAVRICEAKFGILTLYEGGLVHPVAMYNLPPAYAQKVAARMRSGPLLRPHPLSAIGRALSTKRVVHTLDYSCRGTRLQRARSNLRRCGRTWRGAQSRVGAHAQRKHADRLHPNLPPRGSAIY